MLDEWAIGEYPHSGNVRSGWLESHGEGDAQRFLDGGADQQGPWAWLRVQIAGTDHPRIVADRLDAGYIRNASRFLAEPSAHFGIVIWAEYPGYPRGLYRMTIADDEAGDG